MEAGLVAATGAAALDDRADVDAVTADVPVPLEVDNERSRRKSLDSVEPSELPARPLDTDTAGMSSHATEPSGVGPPGSAPLAARETETEAAHYHRPAG